MVHGMHFDALNFILVFVVDLIWCHRVVQPVAMSNQQQAGMKHWVHLIQCSLLQQVKLVSHLTNSLQNYK